MDYGSASFRIEIYLCHSPYSADLLVSITVYGDEPYAAT